VSIAVTQADCTVVVLYAGHDRFSVGHKGRRINDIVREQNLATGIARELPPMRVGTWQ
jgi:hypothetical protein